MARALSREKVSFAILADPYDAPRIRRVSDGGLFTAAWIYSWEAAAVAAAGVAVPAPRLGSFACAIVLVVLSVTAWAAAAGH